MNNTTQQHEFATGGIATPPLGVYFGKMGEVAAQLKKSRDSMSYMEAKALLPEVFSALSIEAFRISADHGFHDKPNIFSERVALMHSELSEALEADRKDLMDKDLPHRSGVEVELADLLIRVFDTAAEMDLDLAGALIEKSAFNEARPHKHGKKY